jgi:tripartite-type tricarboxylate transporter receptor subunit TctC
VRIDRRICAAAIAAAFVVTAGAFGAAAQTYPSKPVRILTGFPPGGPTELIGRVLADHLTKAMGQPFYVEGKPGAAGNVAADLLVNSAPDGSTLYVAGYGVLTVNHLLYRDMKVDTTKDFAPISILASFPLVLEVSTKLPVNDYREFVAYAKQQGGSLNFGSPGIGTLPHLAAELFRSRAGFASTHIPYRGTGPFAQAMGQFELQWAFDTPQTALPLVKNGAVKVFASATAKRTGYFPDVPTLEELGMPDSDWTPWFGLVAPAATPRAIVDQLSAEIRRGFALPENVARLRTGGYEPMPTTPEEMARLAAAARSRWSDVVRKLDIKVE